MNTTSDYSISDIKGGPSKKRYYTPDGREIYAIPQIRDYVIKDKDGKITKQGQRDANYDNGWLEMMPAKKKLFCSSCDKWHDTKAQLSKCATDRAAYLAKFDKLARKELKITNESGKDKEIAELKKMVRDLIKAGKSSG